MEPQDLFPQPNPNPAHHEVPKTPLALQRKFRAAEVKPSVDNSHVEMYAPVAEAPASLKEEYLDEISAKPVKPKLFSGKLLILMVGVAFILVLVAIAGIMSGGNKIKNASGEVLGQRIINLRGLLDYGRNNGVGGSEVNRVMSEAGLILASRSNELTPYYASKDGKTNTFSTPSPEIAASYSLETTTSELDQAKTNSNLNSAYLEALRKELSETETLIEKLYNDSQSEELKAVLSQTYIDLSALSNRLPGGSNSD